MHTLPVASAIIPSVDEWATLGSVLMAPIDASHTAIQRLTSTSEQFRDFTAMSVGKTRSVARFLTLYVPEREWSDMWPKAHAHDRLDQQMNTEVSAYLDLYPTMEAETLAACCQLVESVQIAASPIVA